ncbi:ATP synthase F1 subunit delta [Blattabacterium cuenoti]|uniref:ATP synthase F1 subunit delta n=1 Tax=Blattabacterium cuenoti TaxID=1653831 RepID=UPI00163CA90C|nr:ATP synthase F1 subunit delta [Blattabacterium cuenoti]
MFSNKKIIQHYARVFFEYSITHIHNSEIFYLKIKKTSSLLKENIDLYKIIHTSLLKKEKKIEIFKKILYNFDVFLFQFVKLLILRKRESLLEKIFIEYQKIYEEEKKGLIKSIVISAYPLNKEMQEIIAHKITTNCHKKYENKNKKKFHIINKIDKSIIGGFIFRIGYKEWNFSVQKQLLHLIKIFHK